MLMPALCDGGGIKGSGLRLAVNSTKFYEAKLGT
jgi:hypothetical protein